jgi:ABC-type transport system involved in cytochrome bd biosynthesis fused ATPase/permease subunit
MGSSLSGGQKKRVLLERALYREARNLFLDEGTAQLEGEKEREVEESLRRLGITRINVARRPAMISGAEKIIRFGVGMLLSFRCLPKRRVRLLRYAFWADPAGVLEGIDYEMQEQF